MPTKICPNCEKPFTLNDNYLRDLKKMKEQDFNRIRFCSKHCFEEYKYVIRKLANDLKIKIKL